MLRDLELDRRRVSAHVHARHATAFRIPLPGERFSLTVDGRTLELSETRFRLGAGRHAFRFAASDTGDGRDDTRGPGR